MDKTAHIGEIPHTYDCNQRLQTTLDSRNSLAHLPSGSGAVRGQQRMDLVALVASGLR